ncbi:MAG: AIR synthase-related protein [Anaerolineae bacterium]
MSDLLPVGKLPPHLLVPLLARYAPPAPGVVVGPGLGLDAAVVEMGDRLLVAKSDPITFATDEIGWYAVHVNANDIAALGAAPRWFLATLLLPEVATTAALVEALLAQIAAACAEVGAALVGGHTEISHGLDRPIIVGTMLGETTRERLVTAGGAQVGDAVLLTKSVGLEGTALVAREKADALGDLPPDLLARARDFLHDPGISIVRDAAIATGHGRVRAMHDPTEGGVATGIHEMAAAAGVGFEIDADALPVAPETRALCARFSLDPLGLISSGALLATVAQEDAATVIAALGAAGIAAAQIGRVTPAGAGVRLCRGGRCAPSPTFACDELAPPVQTLRSADWRTSTRRWPAGGGVPTPPPAR